MKKKPNEYNKLDIFTQKSYYISFRNLKLLCELSVKLGAEDKIKFYGRRKFLSELLNKWLHAGVTNCDSKSVKAVLVEYCGMTKNVSFSKTI